jgi:hypothetical protein
LLAGAAYRRRVAPTGWLPRGAIQFLRPWPWAGMITCTVPPAHRQAMRHCGRLFFAFRLSMAVTATLRQAAGVTDPAEPPKGVPGITSSAGLDRLRGGKENRDCKWMERRVWGYVSRLLLGGFGEIGGMADLLAESCPAMRCPSMPLGAPPNRSFLLIAQLMAGWRGSKTHRLSGAPASHLKAVTPCAGRSQRLPR